MNEIQLPEKTRDVLHRIRKKYKVGFEPLRIRDVELNILQLKDLENILAGKDPFADMSNFPFWVKLWEAALLLADMVATMPCQPGQTLLELGAGLGAPGLIAAKKGYKVTLSDYEKQILDFQRVSAAANGLNDVEFRMIDWRKPPEMPLFDTIIGAEILFRDDFLQPLLKIFNRFLAPQGTIYIAHDARLHSLPKFLDLAQKNFQVAVSARKITTDEGELTIIINRLKRK